MKKFTIAWVCIILLVFTFSVMAIQNIFDDTKFALVLNIINTTGIFATFLFAYLLYDRFGTSRKLLDKQNDLIIEYIENIKKIRLNIYQWTSESSYTQKNITIARDLHWIFEKKDKPVLFKSQFYSSKEIRRLYELVNHPLFPTKINDEVDIFSCKVLTTTFSSNKLDFAFISFEDERDFIMENWMLCGDSIDDCVTLNQLIQKMHTLIETLENWVNKESSIKIKLNF